MLIPTFYCDWWITSAASNGWALLIQKVCAMGIKPSWVGFVSHLKTIAACIWCAKPRAPWTSANCVMKKKTRSPAGASISRWSAWITMWWPGWRMCWAVWQRSLSPRRGIIRRPRVRQFPPNLSAFSVVRSIWINHLRAISRHFLKISVMARFLKNVICWHSIYVYLE